MLTESLQQHVSSKNKSVPKPIPRLIQYMLIKYLKVLCAKELTYLLYIYMQFSKAQLFIPVSTNTRKVPSNNKPSELSSSIPESEENAKYKMQSMNALIYRQI